MTKMHHQQLPRLKFFTMAAGRAICLAILTTQLIMISGHDMPPLDGHASCDSIGLMIYTAVFATNWTRDRFPKQYPEFRPPAQWSRVVGASHNDQFRLYQLGAQASPELKLFAETGRQELIGNGNENILDEFLLSAIKNGSGSVSSDFVVDTNHSKVSLISRIIPSPDWFVGIDSLDLCSDGRWVDAVTVEASPLDAGTDSGFTFTAPNWSTDPQEAIYKITSQYPRHAANSFYYPRLQDLPPIATFHISKKRGYILHKTDQSAMPLSTADSLPSVTYNPIHELLQNDVYSWKQMKKKHNKKKRSKKQRLAKAKKCQVGEWGDWSTCNGPCGQSKRERNVTASGEFCPPLLEVRTCGCTKYVFDW